MSENLDTIEYEVQLKLKEFLESQGVDTLLLWNEIENELFSQRRRIEELEKENEDLKKQIEQMKCCGNCQSVFDADGSCYLYKDGKCVDHSEWVKNEYNLVKKEKNNE